MTPQRESFVFRCISFSAALVFLGRGWQHLASEGPYREFLWESTFMKPIVEILGYRWTDYVQNFYIDSLINKLSWGLGIFSILLSFVLIWIMIGNNLATFEEFPKRIKSLFVFSLKAGAMWMAVLAALYFFSTGLRWGQFLEFSLQIAAPIAVVLAISKKWRLLKNILIAATSLTFLGHGLYAIGYYPQPGHFIDMTIDILGVDEDGARLFLTSMGFCDLTIAFAILVPGVRKKFLWIAVIWGFSTAMARLITSSYFSQPEIALLYGIPETLYRLPHSLIPLALVMWGSNNKILTRFSMRSSL